MESPESKYGSINLEGLILYSLYTLQADGKETDLDSITVCAFHQFPRKFSMKNYPEYPDTMRVGREIRRLHSKGKIIGSENKKQYLLSKNGMKEAESIVRFLRGDRVFSAGKSKDKPDRRDHFGKLVSYILSHELFHEFQSDENMKIPRHRYKNLLLLPMNASEKRVREQFDLFLEACENENRKDLIVFLSHCRDHVN